MTPVKVWLIDEDIPIKCTRLLNTKYLISISISVVSSSLPGNIRLPSASLSDHQLNAAKVIARLLSLKLATNNKEIKSHTILMNSILMKLNMMKLFF